MKPLTDNNRTLAEQRNQEVIRTIVMMSKVPGTNALYDEAGAAVHDATNELKTRKWTDADIETAVAAFDEEAFQKWKAKTIQEEEEIE